MKKTVIVAICLMGLSVMAQNRAIEFREGAWKTQLAAAKKENKLIFFDAYTSWCGPCKIMARDVFTKDTVADLFNQTFVNVKYDMEKGEGVALKDKLGVSAFPTYLFVNGNGEVVHKIVGSMSVNEFMKEADNALHSENTVYGLAKSFKADVHSEAKAVAYLDALDKAYEAEEMAKASKIYFDGLAKSTLLEEHNWKLALKYLNNPSSQAFAYLYANKTKLEEKFGAIEVNNYFKRTFISSVYGIKKAYSKKIGVKEAKENSKAIRKLLAQETAYSKLLLVKLDLIEFAAANQWDKFVSKVDGVWVDKDPADKFSDKANLIIFAANDIVAASQSNLYANTLKWADLIDTGNPDLFTKIQLAELRKRVLKRQNKMAESEEMSQKEKDLRKEAADKKQMTPPMMKD